MTTPLTEKRTVRKLTIDITDADAVFAAYPAFKKEDFTKTVLDKTALRKAIRPIVNALHVVNVKVPGVTAYYASDTVKTETE